MMIWLRRGLALALLAAAYVTADVAAHTVSKWHYMALGLGQGWFELMVLTTMLLTGSVMALRYRR